MGCQSSLTSSSKPREQRNFREQFTHFSWGVEECCRASGGPWDEAPNPSSFRQADSSPIPDQGPSSERLLPSLAPKVTLRASYP